MWEETSRADERVWFVLANINLIRAKHCHIPKTGNLIPKGQHCMGAFDPWRTIGFTVKSVQSC